MVSSFYAGASSRSTHDLHSGAPRGLFYSSNEAKERKYVDENKIRMLNDEAQQQVVDAQIDSELGLERQTSNLTKLANRVINKIGVSDIPKITKSKFSDINKNQAENILMGAEDINYALKPLPSTPATTAQLEAQAKAQADLDLISLFQQDVKEGRKRQALKALDEMNAQEDLRLRRNFMKTLVELRGEVYTKNKQKESKKQYEEDKKVLDKMMNLIENQRMHDSFMEFSNLAIRDELATKIQKNLKSLLNYKKNIQTVNKYLNREAIKDFDTKFTAYNKSLLVKKNKNLRGFIDKQEDDYFNDLQSTTDQGSLAGEKFDARTFNQGAPKNDTNYELNKFSDLLIEFNKSKGKERTSINQTLKNIISRQTNKKIAQRMKDLKSALHKR